MCARSAKGFFDAYRAGKSEFEANLAAAEAFFDEFAKGGAGIPADSPCAASTIAYYKAVAKPPSPANKAAMEAFMTKMISGKFQWKCPRFDKKIIKTLGTFNVRSQLFFSTNNFSLQEREILCIIIGSFYRPLSYPFRFLNSYTSFNYSKLYKNIKGFM